MKRRISESTNQRIRAMTARRVRCGSVVKYICDNLDEGLNSRRCREIRKHLQACPNCAAYLDSLKKTVSLYKHVRNPKPRVKTKLALKAFFEHVK